jgi:hypothetical protein
MTDHRTKEFHPLADLFPLIEGKDFDTLVADIKTHGQHEPITLLGDRILEGKNRYRACLEAGVVPTFKSYDGTDPEAYVVSANIHRRHLTAEQKRELINKLIKASPEKSNRQVAEIAKVDHKTVAAVRSGCEQRGEITHVSTHTDTKGRQQPAKKKRRAADDARDVKAKQEAAPPVTPVAPDGELELLRAFARYVIDRVSFDPEDSAEWKRLRERVKEVLGAGPPHSGDAARLLRKIAE